MATAQPLPLDLMKTLIRGNHVLHQHGAVDGFGHISVRHPDNPELYVMSAYLAPALVSQASDLVTYTVNDSSSVDPNSPKGYAERFIHGEMFKRYPDVNCVVHSHAPSVLPFAVVGVDSDVNSAHYPRLKPVFHMGGFLGDEGAPVWDAEKLYEPSSDSDLLVKSPELGASLAAAFSKPSGNSSNQPDHTVVVMRHHGFTTHGPDIQTAIYRTLYTVENAQAQLSAMALKNAATANGYDTSTADFAIHGKVAQDTRAMNERTQDKAWPLWLREVEVNPLYQLNV